MRRARPVQETLVLLLTAVFAAPLVWMVLTAVKSQADVYTGPLWPRSVHLENFRLAWETAPFGRYFLNSLVVASVTTASVLLTSILAAYAFARLRFAGRDWLFLLALGTLMVPGEVLLVPNFVTVKRLGWLDTYAALVVPFAASAFGIFVLRQTFRKLPVELEEAMFVDGASPWTVLWRLYVPVTLTSAAAAAIFVFLGAWNALVWPLVVTGSTAMRTVQVGLASLIYDQGYNLPVLMAAATLVALPVLLVYFAFQRLFVEAALQSGLKS